MRRAHDFESAGFVGFELQADDVAAFQHERLVVARNRGRMLGTIDTDKLERYVIPLRDDDLARLPTYADTSQRPV